MGHIVFSRSQSMNCWYFQISVICRRKQLFQGSKKIPNFDRRFHFFTWRKIRYIQNVWGGYKILSSEGKSGANPVGSTWQSFQFIICMWNETGALKITNKTGPFLKPQKPELSGWVGRWMDGSVGVIKRVLRFGWISCIVTRKVYWFQIWPQKMCTAVK